MVAPCPRRGSVAVRLQLLDWGAKPKNLKTPGISTLKNYCINYFIRNFKSVFFNPISLSHMKILKMLPLVLLLAGSATAQNKGRVKTVQKHNPTAQKTLYRYVEQMPQFDTRRNGPLEGYLTNRVLTAADSLRTIRMERVVVQFRITESGAVQNPRVVQSAGLAFDTIALRVMKKMPDWIPARDSGKTISLDYAVPIRVYKVE